MQNYLLILTSGYFAVVKELLFSEPNNIFIVYIIIQLVIKEPEYLAL